VRVANFDPTKSVIASSSSSSKIASIMPNPTLKTASNFIAIIDMVGAGVLGICVALAWGIKIINEVQAVAKDKSFHPVTYSDLYNDSNVNSSLATLINLILLCMVKMYLGFTLKQGIERNHLLKCKIWLISTTVILGIGVLASIYQISQSSTTIITGTATIDADADASRTISAPHFVGIVMGIVYETFCMFIISMYMRQMVDCKIQHRANAALAHPVRLELNGKPISLSQMNQI
jgi:hypothetical protein